MPYLNAVKADAKFSELNPHLLNILVSCHILQNNPEEALQISDQILQLNPEPDLAVEVLYQKGLTWRFALNDPDKAAEIYREVTKNYPDHPTAISVQAELEALGFTGERVLALEKEGQKIEEFSVRNYPNPFNPTTEIQFNIPQSGNVTIKIYDIQGRIVAILADQQYNRGSHSVYWDGRNQFGTAVASGTYFCQVKFSGQLLNRKMLLLK